MNRFDRALRELRRETPTAGQETARAEFETKTVSRRMPRLIAFGMAATVIAGLTFAMRTPAAATMTMAELRAAAEAAPRMHARWFRADNGQDETMYLEQWQDGPRFRNDFGEIRSIGPIQYGFDGTRTWYRVPAKKYVTVSTRSVIGSSADGSVLKKMFEGAFIPGRKELPAKDILVNGKPMREISFDSFVWNRGRYVHALRYVWTVDPEAKRPYAMRCLRSKGKEWQQISHATFEYPEALDASLFALQPREGETVFDKDEELRTLPALWAKGRGSQTVGGQTITLRDVVLDRQGAAGVIWTGGGRFETAPSVAIIDKTGQKWTGKPYLAYTRLPANRVPESRLTKIDGKPNRMVVMYGLHRAVAPLRVDVPVVDANGKRMGTATFRVENARSTDQLYDLPERMGISEKGNTPARAILR